MAASIVLLGFVTGRFARFAGRSTRIENRRLRRENKKKPLGRWAEELWKMRLLIAATN